MSWISGSILYKHYKSPNTQKSLTLDIQFHNGDYPREDRNTIANLPVPISVDDGVPAVVDIGAVEIKVGTD